MKVALTSILGLLLMALSACSGPDPMSAQEAEGISYTDFLGEWKCSNDLVGTNKITFSEQGYAVDGELWGPWVYKNGEIKVYGSDWDATFELVSVESDRIRYLYSSLDIRCTRIAGSPAASLR